jgi:hypothetical protein
LKTQETRADIIFFNIQFGLEFPLVDWIASDTFPTKIIMEVNMEKVVVAAGMIWLEDFAFEVTAGDILDDSMVRRCQDIAGHVM